MGQHHGPLKRADSVRSAASVQMQAVRGTGLGQNGGVEAAMLLRKSKTELNMSAGRKKPQGTGSESAGEVKATVRETMSVPSTPGGEEKHGQGGDQTNCVLM